MAAPTNQRDIECDSLPTNHCHPGTYCPEDIPVGRLILKLWFDRSPWLLFLRWNLGRTSNGALTNEFPRLSQQEGLRNDQSKIQETKRIRKGPQSGTLFLYHCGLNDCTSTRHGPARAHPKFGARLPTGHPATTSLDETWVNFDMAKELVISLPALRLCQMFSSSSSSASSRLQVWA